MTLRSLLNVTYAYIMRGRNAEQKAEIDGILAEKRYADMTEAERARFDRKMIAIQSGAFSAQRGLVGAMGLPQGRQTLGRHSR